jgi:hypothetical protein
VAAVWAEEDVPAASLVLGGAGAVLTGMLACLGGQQPGEEEREVDWRQRLHVHAAVGVVFRREPVEAAADLPELPLDVDQRREEQIALQAGRLAPPHPGVADRDQHGELVVPAGQQRGSLGHEQ